MKGWRLLDEAERTFQSVAAYAAAVVSAVSAPSQVRNSRLPLGLYEARATLPLPPTVTTQILECNDPNTHRVCSICFFECYASARARGLGGASRGTRTCRGGEI